MKRSSSKRRFGISRGRYFAARIWSSSERPGTAWGASSVSTAGATRRRALRRRVEGAPLVAPRRAVVAGVADVVFAFRAAVFFAAALVPGFTAGFAAGFAAFAAAFVAGRTTSLVPTGFVDALRLAAAFAGAAFRFATDDGDAAAFFLAVPAAARADLPAATSAFVSAFFLAIGGQYSATPSALAARARGS